MSKEYLEALEKLLEGYSKGMAGRSYYDIVYQALQRLETIDNSNPSEALKSLEDLRKQVSFANSDGCIFDDIYEDIIKDIELIKQALIKAQKDKIVADFIREHYKLSNDINKNYLELKKPITEEEHIKIKENL